MPAPMRIVTVVGSLQRRSSNQALVDLLPALAPAGVQFEAALRLDQIPHYNADLDVDPAPPAVETWRQQLRRADAVFLASPEYGHGVPGAVKNALDWNVGSGEFVGKRVAATCASPGKGRGLLGLAALTQTLRAIDALVVWSHPVVVPKASLDAEGRIRDADVERELGLVLRTLLHVAG